MRNASSLVRRFDLVRYNPKLNNSEYFDFTENELLVCLTIMKIKVFDF